MKKSIRKRFTFLIICSVLLPLIIFGIWILHSFKNKQIESQIITLTQNANELSSNVSQTVELCTLSSDVFLNNPQLLEHLNNIENGKNFTVKELYHFSVNDMNTMERLIISNPYLYKVRVYSESDHINEIMPILYANNRLDKLNLDKTSGWSFDYTDTLFGSNTKHLMALISYITYDDGKKLGTLEVSVKMNEIFKNLFDKNQSECIIGDNGKVYGKQLNIKNRYDLKDSVPIIWQDKYNEKPVIITAIRFNSLNSTYYSVYDLSSLYKIFSLWQILFTIIIIIIALVVSLLADKLVKNMLRQLYIVVDCVERFSDGDRNVEIQVVSDDEIGQFARYINMLLSSMNDFIDREIKNEILVKDTEIKALQNQINAHFMYNVLECINMMAQIEEKYEISKAVTDFGKLLRYTIGWKKSIVSLKDEIEYIKNYIALMNLRYDGEITLITDISDQMSEQLIPKVSIQPIVENIIVHSSSSIEDRKIFISAHDHDKDVIITITSDAKEPNDIDKKRIEQSILGTLDNKSTSGNGIGLHNIEQRLKRTFGEQYGMTVIDKGICITVRKQNERKEMG